MEKTQRNKDRANRLKDLGFGTVVASKGRQRLLNRDGSFNVGRSGLGFRSSMHLYYSVLTISWKRFLLFSVLIYLGTNMVFALGYVALGPDAIAHSAAEGLGPRFLAAFAFSVQTLSTIGYGFYYPASGAAHTLVVIESMVGLFAVALGTGVVFARFSRPTARIRFSSHAVIAPYHGGRAFMFRIANLRRSQLLEVQARVLLARYIETANGLEREFHKLELERTKVTFFPLTWTLVHPIDEESPLFETSPEELSEGHPEFLVLLTAVDETFEQSVHVRSSYRASEILWGARFKRIFELPDGDQPMRINIGRIDDIEPAELPSPSATPDD